MENEPKQVKLGKILGKLSTSAPLTQDSDTAKNINRMRVIGGGKKVIASKKPDDSSIKTLANLGDMIKYKRTKSKLSIKRTAMLCQISDKTLRSIEKGDNANSSTLLSVINMLGLKLRLEE